MKQSGTLKITVVGLDELNRKLQTIPRQAEGMVAKELVDITQDLKGESQRKAPLDTGTLRGSAFAETNKLEGTVGYTEVYALRQHEEVSWRHPRGGEAKYLENPFKEKVNKYIQAIGNAVKKAVE